MHITESPRIVQRKLQEKACPPFRHRTSLEGRGESVSVINVESTLSTSFPFTSDGVAHLLPFRIVNKRFPVTGRSLAAGMKNVAYWTPLDDPLKGKRLIYILAHPSREAATSNWKAFVDDPEWQKVRDASEVNGKLVDKVDSTFMTLTDFSPAL